MGSTDSLWTQVLGPVGHRVSGLGLDASDPTPGDPTPGDPTPSDRAPAAAEATFVLWPLALDDAGRRDPRAPVLDPVRAREAGAAWRGAAGPLVLPVLDHAGPAAASWSAERPVGPADVVGPGGRRARPLADEEWKQLAERSQRGARWLREAGVPLVLIGIDDDGLLAATASPRHFPDVPVSTRLGRLGAILEAVRAESPVGVALTVEEIAPDGLDAAGGVELAQHLEALGAELFVAGGGSGWFPRGAPPLADPAVWLAPAAWLVGRVQGPVYAAIPSSAPIATSIAWARAAGLAGVVVSAVGGRS